jgi:hypothetical protein
MNVIKLFVIYMTLRSVLLKRNKTVMGIVQIIYHVLVMQLM